MIEARLAAVLRFVAEHEPASLAKVARQLTLSQSELLRLLAILGDDVAVGGLGLVEIEDAGSRRLLRPSPRGRAWLAEHA
ncbi:hypothetical protein [Arenimonas oryziterrae]|uniref:HTH iclR-type domain-containing protein n=1 Tax=Arenimonas oryziterrae DSM 21050 = YC6267 TaxID=1121015 RepID=A0A091B9R4_9GAMM|nr:hypothetical protein [Arenimonas oryziterrae]KFN41205.1 hypothetical protein N789_04780 [Arenimonas oryziterrae DSM 21050 = YC6267]